MTLADRVVDESHDLADVVVGHGYAGDVHRGEATAKKSASEEGPPSGTDSGPDRRRYGPLLESCATDRACGTHRRDGANETR